MGLHRKMAALRSLRPDIAILSEVANIREHGVVRDW
jgi:hypothetical protein